MSSFSLGSGIIDFLANDAGLQTGLRAVESSMARLQYRMNEIGSIASRAFSMGVRFRLRMTLKLRWRKFKQ
jgi:hypothetical protein